MGEIIKNYGKLHLKNQEFDVELNGPVSDDTGGIIHIQNDDLRVELSSGDFFSMVGAFALAKKELELSKGRKKEIYE